MSKMPGALIKIEDLPFTPFDHDGLFAMNRLALFTALQNSDEFGEGLKNHKVHRFDIDVAYSAARARPAEGTNFLPLEGYETLDSLAPNLGLNAFVRVRLRQQPGATAASGTGGRLPHAQAQRD